MAVVKHWGPQGRRSDWPLAFAAGLFAVLFGLSLWWLAAVTP
jgi:hypothetical protein